MQQTHFNNEYKVMLDFQMFIPMDTLPNDISVIRILKGAQANGLTKYRLSQSESEINDIDKQNQTLSLEGFSDNDTVIF